MSVPRAILQCRFAAPRGVASHCATGSILRLTRTAAPRRQFTSSARFQGKVSQTLATGAEVPPRIIRDEAGGNKSRGIAVTKLDRNLAPAEIQQLLRDAGVDVQKHQFRIDRFTFEISNSAFFELGSEEQVQKAVTALDGLKLGKQSRPLKVSPLADTFIWTPENKKKQRYFLYDTAAPSQAIQALLEGRRYTIFVANPGWGIHKGRVESINTQKQEILEREFAAFNVEAFGVIHPIWKIDRRSDMTFVTYVDFATKEDAQRAVDALNNNIVEGKRMELRPYSSVHPKRAEQIGKVDKGVLAQLQEAGLVNTDTGKFIL